MVHILCIFSLLSLLLRQSSVGRANDLRCLILIKLFYFLEFKFVLVEEILYLVSIRAHRQPAENDCLFFSLGLCVTLGALALRVAQFSACHFRSCCSLTLFKIQLISI